MTISIAMCTFNGGEFLKCQLDSILNQVLLPSEVIISDDGSNDNTLELLQDFKKNASFKVKIYQNDKRLGTRKNIEKAIEITTGDIIFLADQDDVWNANKINYYSECFHADSNALLFFSDGILIDEKGDDLGHTLWEKWGFDHHERMQWQDNSNAFKKLLNNKNKVTGATIAFRSVLKKKALPFYTNTSHWHDAWLALVAAGMQGLRYINQPLILYRIHPSQQVGIGAGINQNPFNEELERLGPFNAQLSRLQFEKRVAELFPDNEIVDRKHIEDEIRKLKMKNFVQIKYWWFFKKVFGTFYSKFENP